MSNGQKTKRNVFEMQSEAPPTIRHRRNIFDITADRESSDPVRRGRPDRELMARKMGQASGVTWAMSQIREILPQEAGYLNTEAGWNLLERGVADPDSLSKSEQKQFKAIREQYPEIDRVIQESEAAEEQFKEQEFARKHPDAAMLDRIRDYFTEPPPLHATGTAQVGQYAKATVKSAADAAATIIHPVIQFLEEEVANEPWPVSPHRNTQTDPLTKTEERQAREWDNLSDAERHFHAARRTILGAAHGAISFLTQTADQLINPEKRGQSHGAAIDEVATGLVDMITDSPDQIGYLATVAFGTPNNFVTKLTEPVSEIVNLPKRVSGETREQIKKDAINHLYLAPESLPFALAILRGAYRKGTKDIQSRPWEKARGEKLSSFRKSMDALREELAVTERLTKIEPSGPTKLPSMEGKLEPTPKPGEPIVKPKVKTAEAKAAEVKAAEKKAVETKAAEAKAKVAEDLAVKQKELSEAKAVVTDLEGKQAIAQESLAEINKEWRKYKHQKLDKAGQKAKAEVKVERDAARAEVSRIGEELAEAQKVADLAETGIRIVKDGVEKPITPRPEAKAPTETSGPSVSHETKPQVLDTPEAIAESVTKDANNPYTVKFDAVEFPPGHEQFTVTKGAGKEYSINFKKGEATPEGIVKRFDEKVAEAKKAVPDTTPPEKVDTGFDEADVGRNLAHAKNAVKVGEQALALKTLTKEQRAIAETNLAANKKLVKEYQAEFDKVEATKGVAGSPGSIASRRAKISMEPKGKTEAISRDKVVDHFRQSFGIPIRVGKFKEKALGIFKIREEVVRTREANELGVISHEVGHYLEKKGYGGLGNKSVLRSAPAAAKKELVAMGKELYGKRKPSHGYRTEGFAEYIAHWLITDEVARIAPEFTKYFEKTFLKENPEIATALEQGRVLIRQYREQGALARVYGNIDMTAKAKAGPIKERAQDILLRLNTLLADDLAPLEFVEKKIRGVSKLDWTEIDPLTSPTLMARSFARTASGKARMMALHGTYDIASKTTGPGLREILTPVANDFQAAITYSYAKRGLELHKRGIDPGITIEDAKFTISKLENPVRSEYHKGLTALENKVMDYFVDAGGMSRDAAQAIMALNPSHIPLKRVIESRSFSGGGGKRFADISSPIKRIKGSGLKIRNPISSIIENMTAMINFADKTRVMGALIDLVEKAEGAGKWVEKLPTPIEARRFKVEDVAKQLEAAGVDMSAASMEQILTVYSNAGLYKGVDNVLSIFRDGERKFYQLDKRLYGTLKAIDELQLPPVIDFLFGRPARAIRLGATGLNAGFGLITNPLRDAFTFGLQTEFTTGSPHLIGKGLINRLAPKNEMNLLYKRSGADFSQFLGMDRKSMQKAVTEVLASDKKSKALNVVGHPIEAMKDLFSFTESAPRLAEFEAAYKAAEAKYGKGSAQASIIANMAGSEVTVNFRRAGVYGRYINQIVPFWNAATQGVLRFGRFAKDHPTQAAIKGVAYVTIPTIAMWMLNKDKDWYRESPPWMRYGFWNIETGTNKDGSPRIVRIPRPFEWGVVFAATPEMVMDYWYSKDPAVVEDGLKYMIDQTVPLGPEYLPTSIKVPLELWTNYDLFRDRDIDPFFEVRYKRPEDRFSKYTLETSKFIGETFGLSPRKIDHLIEATTGGLAEDILRAAEEAAGVRPGPKETPANIPVVGRLFHQTQTPKARAKSLEYQRQEKVGQIRSLMKLGEKKDAQKEYEDWNRRHPDFPITLPRLRGEKE